MVKKILFKGIPAIALVFALGLAACNTGVQEVEQTKIASPKVTAEAVSGGVKLSWAAIAEAGSYSVWRKGGDQTSEVEVTNPDNTWWQTSDGTCEFSDLVSASNNLLSGTEYTYTVYSIARSGVKSEGKGEVKIVTGTMPARGTQVATPSAATMTVDFEKNTLAVSITVPTSGLIPTWYDVSFTCDWNRVSTRYESYEYENGITTLNYSSRNYYGGYDDLPFGEYRATIIGHFGAVGSYDDDSFFEPSDAITATATYEALFGYDRYGNDYLSVYQGSPMTGTGATVTGFYVAIDISNIVFLDGVAYSFERAALDEDGEPEDYAAFTPKKEENSVLVDIASADLVPDILGNMPVSYIYDAITVEGGYSYRVKAEKDGSPTQYRTDYAYLSYAEYIDGTLSVGTSSTTGGKTTFAVTPSIQYRNALQPGDKLEVYWAINSNYSPSSGYYQKAFEFSKEELEAAAPAAQNLVVDARGVNDYYSNLYVIAYIVLADGTRINHSFNWRYSGGVYTTGEFYGSNDYTYYAQLNY